MAHTTKIATCCYCGARTALVLDAERHELACASCGAPLHNMKSIPSAKAKKKDRVQPHRSPGPRHHARRHYGYDDDDDDRYREPRPNRRKKRKNLFRKIVEEAFDVIEDIID